MTALNFPDSPSNGDTYQGYTYNSTKSAWAKPDSPDPDARTAVYANIAALPTSGTAGDMAYVTATNRLYIWTGTGWYNIALINTNPTISGVSSSYALAIDGTATTVTITASDPEGLPITYSIVSDTSGNSATVAQGTGSNTNVFTVTPSTNTAHAGTFSLTFRASDGVNIASSAASFTLQFKVVNQKYTTALITSVGANNAVNNSFDDKSTNDHTITTVGNATQTTFSPYRHGGYSTYFDGTGDRITFSHASDFSFGTGDFTIEFWIKTPTNAITGGYSRTICEIGQLSVYMRITAYHGGVDSAIRVYDESADNDVGNVAIANDIWHHIAVVRESGTMKCWVDGEYNTGVSNSRNLSETGTNAIGARTDGNGHIEGTLADFRVVKGTAVYTGTDDFTPPTERLTAITNTSLLTCHLPYIADGSTTGHSITVYGNTKTQPFAPYDAQEYAAADHGGSLSFDGSGDSLSAAASTSLGLGTGDFTVEWWVNFDTISNYPYQIDMRSADNDTPLALYTNTGSGNVLGVYVSAAVIATGTNAFKPGIWTHYAVCKTGGYLKGYFNGKEDFSITCTRDYGTSEAIRIGAVYGNNNYYVDGNISDVRIVKGTAVYTSAFTPPTTPLTAITNTSLLLSGTDAGIIDKAQSVQTLTLNGNVSSSTTQTKYLTSSMYFDGSGDRIQLPQTSLNLSNADFTVEAWVYTTATSQQTIVGSLAFSNGTGSWLLTVNYNSNKVRFFMRHGGGTVQDAQFEAGTFPTNAWTHVAVTRDGSNLRAFINGTQAGTTNTALGTNAIDNALTNYYIGDNQDGNTYWNGYISDVRITKGLARYTANFTAPTAALQG